MRKPSSPPTTGRPEIKDYIDNILTPINAQQGDKLPVSTFVKDADGTVPLGSAAFEKRGIAVDTSLLAAGELHPVQLLLLCLPPCGYPSGHSERGRSGRGSRRA